MYTIALQGPGSRLPLETEVTLESVAEVKRLSFYIQSIHDCYMLRIAQLV